MNRDFGGPTKLGMIVMGVVFFLIIAGLFYFITSWGRSADPSISTEEAARRHVTAIHSGRSIRMTVYGPVVANEDRQSYEVTVSTTSRRIVLYKGYDQTQIDSKSYDNTYEGYQQFAYALARAGFDKERKVSEVEADDRGACSSGKRYVYELFENGDVIKRVWTTTCGKAKGTFAGVNNVTRDLFNKQIPDYATTIKQLKQFR